MSVDPNPTGILISNTRSGIEKVNTPSLEVINLVDNTPGPCLCSSG